MVFAIRLLMMKTLKYCFLISFLSFLGFISQAVADPSGDRSSFVALVNQIRSAPFDYARKLGYTQELLQSRGILPGTKFEPYSLNNHLNLQAETLNNNGVQNQKPMYLLTTDTKGKISFINFMSASTANKIFIENLLREEIDNNHFRYILSKEYSFIGVSMKSGQLESKMNSWFLAISLGSFALKAEGQILNLINQIRSEPWNVQKYVAQNLNAVFRENWNVYHMLSNEFPPYFLNIPLSRSARDSSFDSLYGTFYKSAGYFRLSYFEKAILNGYDGVDARESIATIAFGKEDTETCVISLFSALLSNELKAWPEKTAIFQKEFHDAGAGISLRSGDGIDLATLSLYTGTSGVEAQDSSKIYGVLFLDSDRNSLYSPGEELAGMNVVVYDKDYRPIQSVIADNAGHFHMTLSSGQYYYFRAEKDNYHQVEKIWVDRNKFVKLGYPPAN